MIRCLIRRGSTSPYHHTRSFSLWGLLSPTNSTIPMPIPITSAAPSHTRSKQKKQKYKPKRKPSIVDPTSAQGVLLHEVEAFAQRHSITDEISDLTISKYKDLDNFRVVSDIEILQVNSLGQGLAIVPDEHEQGMMVVVVPFTTKGDVVDLKIGVHHKTYAEAHLTQVLTPSINRNDKLIRCKYFTSCSGCQLQMIPYEEQLKLKKDIVSNAYKQHGFDIQSLPLGDTVGSPLQYNYRTKLTPHFNSNRTNIKIGFEKTGHGQRGIFQLDECSIATKVLSLALTKDRDSLHGVVRRYKQGGTILLRDTTVDETLPTYTTNHKEIVTQHIGDFKFQFPAGEFFQNNNSILPLLIEELQQHLNFDKHKTLIDTYCGSGFFGISLSKHITRLIGIEISKGNLQYAINNAELNNISNADFKLGSSEAIFDGLTNEVNPNETVVILDPPRKGSTIDYLNQLSNFKPSLIVYVSCNVFSQARDVDYFLKNTKNGSNYTLKLVKGYDFFPQTRHVESLAILELNRTE